MKNIFLFCSLLLFAACTQPDQQQDEKAPASSFSNKYYSVTDTSHLNVSNAEWKKILPPELFAVAREAATEKAFTVKYWTGNPQGTYYCAVCGNKLFKSDAKFESTCGWPSFFEPIRSSSIIYKTDSSHNMVRTEVICARCDSHLGHIFNDGPPPTHKRFCMNSVVLNFVPDGSSN